MKKNYFFKGVMAVLTIFGSANLWSQTTTFDYTGSLQTYVVPGGVTSIEIEAIGAEGGVGDVTLMTPGIAGKGAGMQGNFVVTPGQVLTILVGEVGESAEHVGGGGGGSFVWDDATDDLLIAAGGGGGGGKRTSGDLSNIDGIDASTGENGTNGNGFSDGGGTAGNGGTTPSAINWASGGAGWLTNGANGTTHGCTYNSTGGQTPLSGGAGGTGGGGEIYSADGGYGGGGGGNARCGAVGGGGGGGYSGGGCGGEVEGNNFAGGGGGGSYNSGTDQLNTAGAGTGNGQVIITVLCSPLTVTVSDTEICFGESITLDAESELDGSIVWDGGVVDGEPFTPDATGIITYTATSDADGDCGYSIDIEVFELPEVTASVDLSEICDGDSVVFTSGGTADTYAWDPADVIEGAPYYPATGTTTFTVLGTDDATGCENEASVDVTVNELPDVVASVDDDEICLGESVIFTGSGATDYAWNPAAVEDGEAYAPDVVGTTTYEVTGTDDNGCMNTATVDVTVYDALEITYTTTDEIAGDDGEINITVTGGNPAYSFDWDNDGTGDFDDPEDLTGLTGGTYIVVVEDEAGCTATETVIVGSQVGIGEETPDQLSVYPNPTIGDITVQLKGSFGYQLISITGEILITGTAVNQAEIALSDYADGVYFVRVNSGNEMKSIKIVKK